MKSQQLKVTRYGIYILLIIFAYYILVINFSIFNTNKFDNQRQATVKKNVNLERTINNKIAKGKANILGIKTTNTFVQQGYLIKKNMRPIEVNLSQSHFHIQEQETGNIKNIVQTIQIINNAQNNYHLAILSADKLSSDKNIFIKPTNCDEGHYCSFKESNLWINNKIKGWGYTVTGDKIQSDFAKDYFRPFPDEEKSVIFAETKNDKQTSFTTQIKVKIDLPQDQPLATYNSNIKVIIFPNL